MNEVSYPPTHIHTHKCQLVSEIQFYCTEFFLYSNCDVSPPPGVMMLVAWMWIVSTGILFARHFCTPDVLLNRDKLWFQVGEDGRLEKMENYMNQYKDLEIIDIVSFYDLVFVGLKN